MSRPLPLRPNPPPTRIKHKRHRNQRHANKAQQARRPRDAQVVVQRARDQRKRAGEATPHERVGRHRARAVLGKRVDQIVDRALEDGEEAKAHARGRDVGRDPRDGFVGRPAEHELAASKKNAAEHHGRETRFGDGAAAVGTEAGEVEFLVEEVDDGAKKDADEFGEEGEGAHHRVPAAFLLEDDGEARQKEVEDAVAEGGVQRDEEADRGGEHLEGPDQEFRREFAQRDVPFFVLRVEGPVAALVAEAARFVD